MYSVTEKMIRHVLIEICSAMYMIKYVIWNSFFSPQNSLWYCYYPTINVILFPKPGFVMESKRGGANLSQLEREEC